MNQQQFLVITAHCAKYYNMFVASLIACLQDYWWSTQNQMQPIQFFCCIKYCVFHFSCTSYWQTNYDLWVTQTSDSSGFLLRAFTFIYYSQILQICTVYMVLSSASIRTPDQPSVYHSRMLSKKIEMHALIFSIITTVRRHSEKQAIHISYSLLLRYFKRQQQLQWAGSPQSHTCWYSDAFCSAEPVSNNTRQKQFITNNRKERN